MSICHIRRSQKKRAAPKYHVSDAVAVSCLGQLAHTDGDYAMARGLSFTGCLTLAASRSQKYRAAKNT